jgi:hypothetical protein
MKRTLLLITLLLTGAVVNGMEKIPLRSDGTIPVWLTNGPFEIRTVGFGDLSPDSAIAETCAAPFCGMPERNGAAGEGRTAWQYTGAGDTGFTDLNEYYGWRPLASTEKIWYAKVVYAYTALHSEAGGQAVLRFGGNTITRIVVNGETVYSSLQEINAVRDGFSVPVALQKGTNRLLIAVANTHRNHAAAFFDPLRFEWGFYCRLTGPDSQPIADISVQIDPARVKPSFALTPTFFYKEEGGHLLQKYFLEIHSASLESRDARFTLPERGETRQIGPIRFGLNQRELYLPEAARPVRVKARLEWAGRSLEKTVELRALPKYELYFAPTTHMDIGYTNPQPIVIERQLQTLDQVVQRCETDGQFKWTIETMWLLDNYRQSRSAEAFARLISLIKKGRIAVSPIYTNPYTGWVSEAEMAAAFRLAEEYRKSYGLEYLAAVYNDVPGQSWALPQYLRQAGIKVLIDGINEIFADYKFQKSLPKVFKWAGSSSDTLLLYLTEAYVEGSRYGLERDTTAAGCRIWHRVNNLLRRGYPYTRILISGAFSDNSGIALNQYENALRWNQHYAWPRFIIATLNDFGRQLCAEDQAGLETIRGDWTSDWDILYQGETRRMVRYRQVQNQLPGSEIMASLASALHPESRSGAGEIDRIYDDLLCFSGHGSGLEYGLGTREENLYTNAVREEWVDRADLESRALRERMAYRIAAPKESFESQGLLVFNTLSWERTMPVEVDLPATDLNSYRVIDLATGETIAAHRSGERLSFIAAGVPGIGSRQYELVATPAGAGSPAPAVSADAGTEIIENRFYRIQATKKGWEILDKLSGGPLLDPAAVVPSFIPLRKRFQLHETFTAASGKGGPARIEKNDLFEEMVCPYDGPLFRSIRFRLWRDLNRIDVALLADLAGLATTEHTEEYGLAFAFNTTGGSVRCETLGGLTGLDDRFQGVGHTFFSIRRAIGIEEERGTFLLASPDCRIFALDSLRGGGTVIANVINNFPDAWNRNEVKNGSVTFRFAIAKTQGAGADVAAFGWEGAADPIVRRSWYTRAEPLKSYLVSSNPRVKILSLRPVTGEGGRYDLLLQNSEPAVRQEVTLTSWLFLAGARATRLDLLGRPVAEIAVKNNAITVSLSANEFVRIRIERNP